MGGLEAVFGQVMASGLAMQAWVDGSFLTEKMNPDDSDVVFRVARADWVGAQPAQKAIVFWINQTDMKLSYRCDSYAFVDDAIGLSMDASEWGRSYWIRQWGFSRNEEAKGVAVIMLPYVIT
jgi:hypothetical protein